MTYRAHLARPTSTLPALLVALVAMTEDMRVRYRFELPLPVGR